MALMSLQPTLILDYWYNIHYQRRKQQHSN